MPDNTIHKYKFMYFKIIKNKTNYFLLSLMLIVFIHFCHRKYYASIMKASQLMLLREIITFYCWNLILSIHILWGICMLKPDGTYRFHCALKGCMFKCKGFHSIVFECPTYHQICNTIFNATSQIIGQITTSTAFSVSQLI